MAKKINKTTELMLTRRVGRNGPGEVIKVKRGFARNWLIPQKIGISVKGNEDKLAAQIAAWKAEDAQKQTLAQEILEKLKELKLQVQVVSGVGGTLYGSVSANTISTELAKQGIEIARQDINMMPIKLLGNYKIKVRVYGGQMVEIGLSVTSAGSA